MILSNAQLSRMKEIMKESGMKPEHMKEMNSMITPKKPKAKKMATKQTKQKVKKQAKG